MRSSAVKMSSFTPNTTVLITLRRCRDDHLACTGFEVQARLLLARKDTGRFHNHIDAEGTPWEVRRIAFSRNVDGRTVDNQVSTGNFNRSVETSVDAVKLQQVRKGVDISQVINGNNREVAAVQHLTEGQSADSAKTIDGNFFHSRVKFPFG